MAITTTYGYTLDKTPFQVNGWTIGDPLLPDALGLRDGGHVVVQNHGSANKGFLSIDFYNANNVKVGQNPLLPQGNFGWEVAGEPSLAQLDNGNVIMVFDANDPKNKESGVKAVIFSPEGEILKDAFAITAGNIGNLVDVDVTALSNDNFVVSYTQGTHVFFKIHDEDGVEQVGTTIIETTPGYPMYAQITALKGPDGGFVAVWNDYGVADVPLRARIFNDNGTERVKEFKIDGFGDNTQASVAALKNGGFAVAYADTGWLSEGASDIGISLKVYDGNGVAFGGAKHVNTGGPAIEANPDITVLDNGFIAVSWSSPSNVNDDDLHVRVFTDKGVPVLNEFIIGNANGDASHSSLASLIGGQFFAAYQNSEEDASNDGQITGVVMGVQRITTADDIANSIVGDELADVVKAKGGNDTVLGGGGEDRIEGGDGVDLIRGQAGNDELDGGAEKDVLRGGEGDDVYHASEAGEAIEGADQGIDMVYASSHYVLGANIENLDLEEGDGYNGTGNDLANLLIGNSDDNVLNGKAGNDTMQGWSGDDTYLYTAGDKLIEKASGGYDTVKSAVGALLGEHFEQLIITGAGNANGAGNIEDNVLVGNSGLNALYGKEGSDLMTGGGGADTFAFDVLFKGTGDVDEITDFQSGVDQFMLFKSIFTGMAAGDLAASAFHVGASAADASDRIIYNKVTGSLFWDADGSGGQAQAKFAEVDANLNLTHLDFFVL